MALLLYSVDPKVGEPCLIEMLDFAFVQSLEPDAFKGALATRLRRSDRKFLECLHEQVHLVSRYFRGNDKNRSSVVPPPPFDLECSVNFFRSDIATNTCLVNISPDRERTLVPVRVKNYDGSWRCVTWHVLVDTASPQTIAMEQAQMSERFLDVLATRTTHLTASAQQLLLESGDDAMQLLLCSSVAERLGVYRPRAAEINADLIRRSKAGAEAAEGSNHNASSGGVRVVQSAAELVAAAALASPTASVLPTRFDSAAVAVVATASSQRRNTTSGAKFDAVLSKRQQPSSLPLIVDENAVVSVPESEPNHNASGARYLNQSSDGGSALQRLTIQIDQQSSSPGFDQGSPLSASMSPRDSDSETQVHQVQLQSPLSQPVSASLSTSDTESLAQSSPKSSGGSDTDSSSQSSTRPRSASSRRPSNSSTFSPPTRLVSPSASVGAATKDRAPASLVGAIGASASSAVFAARRASMAARSADAPAPAQAQDGSAAPEGGT